MDAQKIQCTARSKRSGEQCKRWATTGKTVCHMHGGAELSGRPQIHGFYSKAARGKLAQRIQDAEEMENPLDMTIELILDRAILSGILDKYDFDSDTDFAETELIIKITETISRKQQRIHQVHNQTSFSIGEMNVLMGGMKSLLSDFIPDPTKRKLFIQRLRQTVPRRHQHALSMPKDE